MTTRPRAEPAGEGSGDRLAEYRRRRDPARTPEPVPAGPVPRGASDTFVIQQHHARRLHWDLRLERDGVLASWAVPRGLPREPGVNRLAVHTEDHPIEYASFTGTIPAGEYGAGHMIIFDRGYYETHEWTDRKVGVTLHGSRIQGRYVLFATSGRDWMIRRLDPPTDPAWQPLPDHLAPMRPTRQASLPRPADRYRYEFDWAGQRAIGHVASGRLDLLDESGAAITDRYPGMWRAAEPLGATEALLDGEVAQLDNQPVYLVYDLLHLDGRSLLDTAQADRRELLESLRLNGTSCQIAPSFEDAAAVLTVAAQRGLPGIVARRVDARYQPGRRSTAWKQIPTH